MAAFHYLVSEIPDMDFYYPAGTELDNLDHGFT